MAALEAKKRAAEALPIVPSDRVFPAGFGRRWEAAPKASIGAAELRERTVERPAARIGSFRGLPVHSQRGKASVQKSVHVPSVATVAAPPSGALSRTSRPQRLVSILQQARLLSLRRGALA